MCGWFIISRQFQGCSTVLQLCTEPAHIYVFLFRFFPLLSHYKVSSTASWAMQQAPVAHLCCVHCCVHAYPKLLLHPSPSLPLWSPLLCFLCLWVCFCFVNKFICICVFFLDSISGQEPSCQLGEQRDAGPWVGTPGRRRGCRPSGPACRVPGRRGLAAAVHERRTRRKQLSVHARKQCHIFVFLCLIYFT